jgi:hypothetical protein
VNQRIETDGWYIDLSVGLDCQLGRRQMMANPMTAGGCQDRTTVKREGTARTGYPLIETVTMRGADGGVLYTTTKEVLELSREPLEAALFDVPQGYTETKNSQELYGIPSTDASVASTKGQNSESNENVVTTGTAAKQPGIVRVGVVTINNQSDRPVSVNTLRERLVAGILGAGSDAVPLNATSQAEAEAEARAKQCDFILYTDISGMKISAAKKLGGFLGKATGVTSAGKTEARVDYKLFAVGESSPRLQSSATGKEEGDEASVGSALDTESRSVAAEVRKRP